METTCKFGLLWLCGDDDDHEPFIVVNPPDNFRELLDKWNDMYIHMGSDVMDIYAWLESNGVQIRTPDHYVL